MKKRIAKKVRTAYHEAGHALTALHFGFIVGTVSIVPDEGRLGHASNEGPWAWKEPEDWERAMREEIIVLYAGEAAVALINEENAEEGTGSDQEQIDEYAHILVLDDAELGKLKAESYALVQQLRQQIKIVAEMLLEHKRVTGDDIEVLLDTGNLPFWYGGEA